MRKFNLAAIIFIVFSLSQCGGATDFKTFIIGTWKGHSDLINNDQVNMLVTFNRDNMVALDYTPSGGKKINATYQFIGENRIRISQYSVVIFIREVNDNEISFVPEAERVTKDSDMIFLDSFQRAN